MNRWAIGSGIGLSVAALSTGVFSQLQSTQPENAKLPSDIEAMYKQLVQEAQAKANNSHLDQAIADVSSIPPNSEHFATANQLRERWFKDLLQAANEQHQQANLSEAIKQLKAIPASSPEAEHVKLLIATWTQQEKQVRKASEAVDKGNWSQTIAAINELRGTDLFESPQIQALAQKAITNAFASDPATRQLATDASPSRLTASVPTINPVTPRQPAPSVTGSVSPEQRELATLPSSPSEASSTPVVASTLTPPVSSRQVQPEAKTVALQPRTIDSESSTSTSTAIIPANRSTDAQSITVAHIPPISEETMTMSMVTEGTPSQNVQPSSLRTTQKPSPARVTTPTHQEILPSLSPAAPIAEATAPVSSTPMPANAPTLSTEVSPPLPPVAVAGVQSVKPADIQPSPQDLEMFQQVGQPAQPSNLVPVSIERSTLPAASQI